MTDARIISMSASGSVSGRGIVGPARAPQPLSVDRSCMDAS
jgi:hypothetical protein